MFRSMMKSLGKAHLSSASMAMVLVVAVFASAVLSGCAGRSPLGSDDPLQLRVMTYNIRYCRGMDGEVDIPRIAGVINASNPDLVSLQEVDMRTRRALRVDQTAELARLTGMHAQFGRAIDFQGGEYGQAILSRWPISEFDVVELPSEPDQEQRVAVAAGIRGEGNRPDILFVGTHLHHREEELRLPQVERLLEYLRESPWEVKFLTGDINARPDSATLALIYQEWEDTTPDHYFTFPSPEPNRKIDYILFPRGHPWRVVHSEVIDEPVASDHRPVFAVLEWMD